MLSKLMKYDFKSMLKYFYSTSIFILIYSCIATLFFNFTKINNSMHDSVGFTILITLLTIFYVVLAISYCIGIFAICIVNFYKSMVTDQGYLTHTLPVKKSVIILSKFIVSNILCIMGTLIVIISAGIYFDFPSIYTIYHSEFQEILQLIYENIGLSGIILLIILALTSAFANLAMFYLAIALGQLVNKHKALGSLLFYFALLFVYQILTTAFGFVTTSVNYNNSIIYQSNTYTNTSGNFYLTILIALILNLALTFIQLFITHFIFKKKLNLE